MVVFIVFEADAAGQVVGVLQASEFFHDGLDSCPAGLGVLDLLRGSHGLADFKDEEATDGFVGVGAAVVLAGFDVFFFEAIELGEAILVKEPVLVAGGAPFGEVLVGDGVAVEYFGEDFFSFWKFVDPGEDGAAELAVVEAVVEFFADGFGEAGDFAESGGHR